MNLTNPRDLIVVTAAAVLRAVQGEAELQGLVPKTSPPFPVQALAFALPSTASEPCSKDRTHRRKQIRVRSNRFADS